MNVGFIGLGKLGLTCAEVMAEKYQVTGYDIQPRSSNKVRIAGSVKDAVEGKDIVFIAVQTPHDQSYDGRAPAMHLAPKDFDYAIAMKVLEEVNQYATKEQLVVLISTCLPGTTRKQLVDKIPNARFIYNPYLIAMGSVEWDMVNPEMVIIGTEDGSTTGDAEMLISFYKPLMENNPRYVVGTWDEAESIKIFYNTFISAKIGLSNMILDVAVKNGNINVDVVTNALAESTTRIMSPKYMKAGMGDSGPCVLGTFPVVVNGARVLIEDLFTCDISNNVCLVESATYAVSKKDEKKIHTVTCREFSGKMYKIIAEDGSSIEVTGNHIIPVMRNAKRELVQAKDILPSDRLYKLS